MRRRKRRGSRRRLYHDLMIQRYRYVYNIARRAAEEGDLDYAAELGRYLRELAKRAGVRLPREIKRGLCKNCGLPLIPGVTARVRLRSQGCFSYIVVTCKRCGWIHRYPYRKVCKGAGEPKEGGATGAPQQGGRYSGEEGSHAGGGRGDKEEARAEGSDKSKNIENRG